MPNQTLSDESRNVVIDHTAFLTAVVSFETRTKKDFKKSVPDTVLSQERLRQIIKGNGSKPIRVMRETLDALATLLCVTSASLIQKDSTSIPYAELLCKSEIVDPGATQFGGALSGDWTVSLTLDPNLQEKRPWCLEKTVAFEQHSHDGKLFVIGFKVDVEENGVACRWEFSGCLLEGGNVVMGMYKFIQPDGKPKHGHVAAMREGDRIQGRFIGRSPNYGIVYGEMKADKVV